MNNFGPDFHFESPAETDAIVGLEKLIARKLPEDYKQFLLRSNGGEGPLGTDGYLCTLEH
jgi:SMI1 / KNR4 family (SUKH-1)